jgi:hypothetical protein
MKALLPQHSIEFAPMGVSAQNWTSDEQALIAAIEHCWDRTANEQPTPNHVVSWILLSQDFRPIHVKVGSDFGFIYFHSIRLWESVDGTRETESWPGFEVWKRTPGGWSFHGEAGTPGALNAVH